MTLYARKLHAVLNATWFNPPVGFCSAKMARDLIEFYQEKPGTPMPCFMAVAWWGDDAQPLPAGFTRFTFCPDQPAGDVFAIVYHDEPRPTTGTLAHDDLVLVYGSDFHAYGSREQMR
jgi:hypothetical protein